MTRLAPIALALSLAGCGYVGDPQPPALKTPLAVRDLKAFQRGAKVILEFTVPERTVEDLPLPRIGEIEVRGGPSPEGEFRTEAWAAAAVRLRSPTAAPGAARVEVPAAEWIGRSVIFGVRASNPNGRFSDWSNLVSLPVVEPLARPEAVTAEAAAEGVRLRWQAAERSGVAFRILRRSGEEQQPAEAGHAGSREWIDTSARHGVSYEYRVRAVLPASDREAESEVSDAAVIVPRDTFPPAVPKGLTAIAAPGAIELGWERNTEADFAGYIIYRSKNAGVFERLADRVATPSFSDRSTTNGAKYSYAVSAVDQLGNESPRSAPAEIELR